MNAMFSLKRFCRNYTYKRIIFWGQNSGGPETDLFKGVALELVEVADKDFPQLNRRQIIVQPEILHFQHAQLHARHSIIFSQSMANYF